MHRLLQQCASIRLSTHALPKHLQKNQLPCLYSVLRNNTTTTKDPPLLAKYKDQLQQPQRNGSDLWSTYQAINAQGLLQHMKRDDFLKLRADLWKQENWGTEDRILQVLDDMKRAGHPWNLHEYNEYFMAKLFKAQYADILAMYSSEEFQGQQLSIGSFNVILATYIQLGKTKEAIQLIEEANKKHNVIPDIRDFDRTMNRCMPKNTQLSQVAKELIAEHAFSVTKILDTNLLHLFREKRMHDIKWIVDQQLKRKLNITTYNILIKGYSDVRMLRDATHIYEEMQKHSVRPNTYICVSMLAIFAHTRDVAAAEQVVRETVLGGHKPDEGVYNQLIKVYFKARQSQKAFQAFQEIQKDPQLKVNDVILNTMINGLVINKELHIATLLYKQMIQSQLKPDMVTLNTMLKGYVKSNDMALAAGIISDMFKLGMEPDSVTLTTLVDSVFNTKSPNTAEEMMGLVRQMGIPPNVYAYNAVINSWIQADNMREAEKTFDIMKKEQLKPTIHTYTNLVQGYIAQMNLGKAMETFQNLMKSGIRPDRATFNFMIVGFLNHGRLNDAYTCLDHMLRMKLSPTKDTWKLLLDDCCKSKDWQTGKKVIDKLDQSGFVIKSDSLRRSYTIVKSHYT